MEQMRYSADHELKRLRFKVQEEDVCRDPTLEGNYYSERAEAIARGEAVWMQRNFLHLSSDTDMGNTRTVEFFKDKYIRGMFEHDLSYGECGSIYKLTKEGEDWRHEQLTDRHDLSVDEAKALIEAAWLKTNAEHNSGEA